MNDTLVRRLGTVDYEPTVSRMREFTDQRAPDSADELWLLQHPAVFTLGQAADAGHVLTPHNIAVVQTDRGGQVTYHGPGQLVAYVLVDLKRLGIGVRTLVHIMEESVIALLHEHGVTATSRRDAPGVYVGDKKIAALGLRVRRGCTFHGLSLNVDMNLSPFTYINPCGYAGLEVTQLRDEGIHLTVAEAGDRISAILDSALGAHAKAQ
ncbi:MAG: lipoyl(octanoyl) transferase LipB [Pseudomonadota bacterium]